METKIFGIRMPAELRQKVEERAKWREESASEAAIKLIKLGLEHEGEIDPSPRHLANRLQELEDKLDALIAAQSKHATGLKKIDDRLERIGKVLVNVFEGISNLCKNARLPYRVKSHHPLDVHPSLPEIDFESWQ